MPSLPHALASSLLLAIASVAPNAAHAAADSHAHGPPASVSHRRTATAAGPHDPTPAHHAAPSSRPKSGPKPTTHAPAPAAATRAGVLLAAQDTAAAVPADFNGDSKPDLVWVNYTTGAMKVAYMDGPTKLGEDALGQMPQNWWLAAVGSFDGDGQPDLFFRNYATGENQVWLMNGIAQVDTVVLPSLDPSWVLSSAADFDGDGQTDLVWRNYQTHEDKLWRMNGATMASTVDLPLTQPHWLLEAAADLNGDGQTDLVWANPADGQNGAWLMNGTSIASNTSDVPANPDPNWRITGNPYLAPDGRAGVVYRNYLTGENAVAVYDWNQPDPTKPKVDPTRSFSLPPEPDTDWQLVDPVGVDPASILSPVESNDLDLENTILDGGGYNDWDGGVSRLHALHGALELTYPPRAATSSMYQYKKQQLEQQWLGKRIQLDAQVLPPLGTGYKMLDPETGHTALFYGSGGKAYVQSNDAWL
jgi:FG-GAP-like repeat/FG-GAP repeat